MTAEGKPRAPNGLGPSGRWFWKAVWAEYSLRPDEVKVLESACRLLDRIDKMEEELEAGDVMVRGSRGQPVVNPLVGEIRQHRDLFARLAGRMALTDELSERRHNRSTVAREAAIARWRGRA